MLERIHEPKSLITELRSPFGLQLSIKKLVTAFPNLTALGLWNISSDYIIKLFRSYPHITKLKLNDDFNEPLSDTAINAICSLLHLTSINCEWQSVLVKRIVPRLPNLTSLAINHLPDHEAMTCIATKLSELSSLSVYTIVVFANLSLFTKRNAPITGEPNFPKLKDLQLFHERYNDPAAIQVKAALLISRPEIKVEEKKTRRTCWYDIETL